MRLSARRTDPEYDARLVARALILLDGVAQKRVIVADEEKGEIHVASRDEHGRMRFEPDGSIRVVVLKGRVEIRFKPEPH